MKKNFYNTFMLLTITVIMASCSGNVTTTVQPGTWQWKNASATADLATVNTPVTLNTAYDVITLRYQFYVSMYCNASSLNGTASGNANLQAYLQYYDAGTASSYSNPAAIATYGIVPPNTQRHAGANVISNNTTGGIDRFSGTGGAITTGNYSSAAISQTDNWHTVADEGTTYSDASGNAYKQAGAAFVMASTSATVSNATTGTTILLAQPTSPWAYAAYTSATATTTNPTPTRKSFVYTSTNGPTASTMRPINLAVSANGSSTAMVTYLYEIEFHIKANIQYPVTSTSKFGVKGGNRYFFRIRIAGDQTTTVPGTFGGTSSSSYTIYLSPYGIGGATSDDPNLAQTSTDPIGTIGYYKVKNPFPYLDVASNIIPNTLPVIYSQELTATGQGNTVVLNWATANEINNKYFDVERSANLNNWVTIGTANSYFDNGTGNGHAYTLTDNSPLAGKSYYRIVQYDLDGKSNTSRIVTLTRQGQQNLMLYPNPAHDQIVLEGAEIGAMYAIYSMAGQFIKTGTVTNEQQTIALPSLATGTYILKVQPHDGKPVSIKFLVR
ncbi:MULTISPECIES: T9SS type A sorting domain-containing protein [Chitinophagaceae]